VLETHDLQFQPRYWLFEGFPGFPQTIKTNMAMTAFFQTLFNALLIKILRFNALRSDVLTVFHTMIHIGTVISLLYGIPS
jgi:hypothetical protein